jgi:hypothetical protein
VAIVRPGRGVRVGILAAVLAWHALVVLLLWRQGLSLPPPGEELVTTWLRLERESPPRVTLPPVAQLVTPRAVPLVPADPSTEQPPETPVPSTSITVPPRFDWYGEASRAARDQYAKRLPVPRSLDDEPEPMMLPAPRQGARELGDQEPAGQGEWKVWLGDDCYTIVRSVDPPRPGEFRPMIVTCPGTPPIDPSVLEGRRPDYLNTPTLKLPRRGQVPGRTRTGPSMGGPPGAP